MRFSDDIAELSKALAKAQEVMGSAIKNKTNDYYKNGYADLEAVILTANPALTKNDIALLQEITFCAEADEKSVKIVTRIQHASGQFIESELVAPVKKDDNHSLASTFTYFRRHAILALLTIPVKDDDDDGNKGQSLISPEQAKELRKLLKKAKMDEKAFTHGVRIAKLEDLESHRYEGAVKHLEGLCNN